MEEAKVWEALRRVLDPERGNNIVDLGWFTVWRLRGTRSG